MSERKLTVWELCRACADQMFNGIRCEIHNPTPEQIVERKQLEQLLKEVKL